MGGGRNGCIYADWHVGRDAFAGCLLLRDDLGLTVFNKKAFTFGWKSFLLFLIPGAHFLTEF
jgi:hypothetical protein